MGSPIAACNAATAEHIKSGCTGHSASVFSFRFFVKLISKEDRQVVSSSVQNTVNHRSTPWMWIKSHIYIPVQHSIHESVNRHRETTCRQSHRLHNGLFLTIRDGFLLLRESFFHCPQQHEEPAQSITDGLDPDIAYRNGSLGRECLSHCPLGCIRCLIIEHKSLNQILQCFCTGFCNCTIYHVCAVCHRCIRYVK